MNTLHTFLHRLDVRPVACMLLLVPFILIYLALASSWTNPLIPLYNGDSAAFFAMGDGLLHGKLPYRDMFDHKGPLLYLIYALGGYFFSLRTGLLVLQCMNFCVCSFCAYRIARLKLSPAVSWIVVALFLIVCAGGLTGGGLTEEWSLPFNLIPFYLVFRKLTRHTPFSPLADAGMYLLLGASLGVHAMLRVTNAAPVCGLIGFLGLYFICLRSWKSLFMLSLLSIIGASAIVLPFVCWYAMQGALADLHFGVLGYNCLYAAQGTASKSTADYLHLAAGMLCLPLFCVRALYHFRKRSILQESLCSVCVGLVCVVALIPGRMYSHYFLIAVTAILWATVVSTEVLLKTKEKKKRLLRAAVLVLILLPYLPSSVRMFGVGAGNLYHCLLAPDNYHIFCVSEKLYEEQQVAHTIDSLLPADKEAAVLAYSSNPGFLLYMDRRPCFKYFFIQGDIRRIYPSAVKEMQTFFAGSDTADWVIFQGEGVRETAGEQPAPSADPVVHFIRTRCEKVGTYGKNAKYTLYKRVR